MEGTMIEKDIEISMAEGTADAVFFHPDGDSKLPGVIHLTDIGGIRPSHREMARRLAAKGYAVLMPNVFFRAGKPPMFDFTPQMGEERTMKRFGELSAALTPANMDSDGAAYVDFLSRQNSVAATSVGVVGYCFTGAMAMRTAAARPDKVAAVATFHGGGLFTIAPTSPHLVLPRIKARMHIGHATKDQSMPAEAIERLDQALKAWGGSFKSEVYERAFHGWTVPDSPVYNQAQADRAFENMTALFAQATR
jgi:carboxymethylenebutenolidase